VVVVVVGGGGAGVVLLEGPGVVSVAELLVEGRRMRRVAMMGGLAAGIGRQEQYVYVDHA